MNDSLRLEAMFKLLELLPAQTRSGMVRMYSDSLVEQVQMLGQCLAQGQAEACASIAHKIAGSAAMMQDQELSQAARAAERALVAGRPDEALGHWPQVQACADFTLQALRRRYPGAN